MVSFLFTNVVIIVNLWSMKTPTLIIALLTTFAGFAQPEIQIADKLKAEAAKEIEKNAVLGQQINDMLFSFAELGFQEVETQTYLTSLLEKNGFKIQKGIANVPTAWIA